MKYGRFRFSDGNLGDQAQLIGLNVLYKMMDIPEEDIIDIDYSQLFTYRGSKLICPIYGCHVTKKSNALTMNSDPSPDIIPVFLGIFAADYGVPDHLRKILAKNGNMPILCRDEFTADVFRKNGYHNAVFWGCLSLLTPTPPLPPLKSRKIHYSMNPA